MYKKILAPLDGSDLAECTLSHVKNLYKDGLVREVTLLNVFKFDFPWSAQMSPEQEISHFDFNAIREKLADQSSKYLAGIKSRLGSEGVKVKTESLEGNRPADTITVYAQEKDMDIIIIGTHGFTGLKKLMLGSVAFSVLHQSHIPVLLIRPESCQI